MNQCTATLDFTENTLIAYPVTVNDEGMYNHVKRVGERLLGNTNVGLSNLVMGAEDFSFYTQRVPSAFFSIGVRNESIGAVHLLHSPYFFIDEEALPIGAALHTAVAVSYLDPTSLEM